MDSGSSLSEPFSIRNSTFVGFIFLVWFGALNQALYDYWTAIVAFTVITLLACIQLETARRARQTLYFPLLLPWCLWIAAVWISVWGSFDVTTSLWEAWEWTFCLVVFYLSVNTAKTLSRETFTTALQLAGLVVVPLALMAIHQQLTGRPLGYGVMHVPLLGDWHYGHWEIHATLMNSIVFSGFLLSWAYVYWPNEVNGPLITWLPFAFLVAGMLAARSWTTFIGFLMGAAACYVVSQRERAQQAARLIKFIVPGIVLIGLALLWKTHQHIEGAYYDSSMRFVYWKAAYRMFIASPLNGVGLGAYAVAFPYFKQAAGESTRLAHGLLWQLGAETGGIGLLAFFGLLITSATALLHHRQTLDPEHRRLGVTLITLLLCGLTTIHFDYFLNKLIFVFFAGILCAQLPNKRSFRPTAFTNVIAIPVFVSLASIWLSLFQAERLYAAGNFAAAINLNHYHADSWFQLALQEKNPQQAALLRQTAWHWKKDKNFITP
jgi:hypothetical protein